MRRSTSWDSDHGHGDPLPPHTEAWIDAAEQRERDGEERQAVPEGVDESQVQPALFVPQDDDWMESEPHYPEE